MQLLACLLLLALAVAAAAADCAAFDSCDGAERTCDCAPSCVDKGTCCADVEHAAVEQTLFCRQEPLATPVFARQRCTLQHSRALCEKARDDPADVLGSAPYTHTTSGRTYWNKHCAVCNGEDQSRILQWPVQVMCPSRHGALRFGKSQIIKNLTFDPDSGVWGLRVQDGFLACSVQYVQPHSLRGKLDYCAPNIVSKCPDDTTDKALASKCESYHAERRHKVSGQYFRNPECALCHGVAPEQLECVGRHYTSAPPEQGDTVKVTFGGGYWVDHPAVCSHGNTFDPFTRTCRKTPPATKSEMWPVRAAAERRAAPTVVVIVGLMLILGF